MCAQPRARTILADRICEEFKLPLEAVTAYVSIGKRELKTITIPFVNQRGTLVTCATPEVQPTYRVRVFLDHVHQSRTKALQEFVNSLIAP
jgi:hypothetical protein